MSNYTMKAIVLYLGPNFEKKWSEVHDLELKYLTNEPEPIRRIMNSQSYIIHASLECPLGLLPTMLGLTQSLSQL